MTLHIRQQKPEDTPGVLAIINAHSQATIGTNRAMIDADGDLRRARYVSASADSFVAVQGDQRQIIGTLSIHNPEPHNVFEVHCSVHPDHDPQAVASALLDYAEGHARARLDHAPEDVRVVLQANVFEQDSLLVDVLRARGFERVRQWMHLDITMTEKPSEPVWAGGITVREFDEDHDWDIAGPAMDEAFMDHWGTIVGIPPATEPDEPEALDEDDEPEDDEPSSYDPYSNSRGLCFLAIADSGEVAGVCLCNEKAIEWPETTGKLGSLSVRRTYRRMGIGRALTLHAMRAFYDRGIMRLITDTDSDNFTRSYGVYEGVGMREFRREDCYEKELRAGREVRLMTPAAT